MNVGTTTRERNRGQCSSCVEQPTALFNMTKHAGTTQVKNISINISEIFITEKENQML